MLPGGSERLTQIDDGHAGSFQTLQLMRRFMVTSDPLVDFAAEYLPNAPAFVFEWVRHHMIYMPDFNNGVIIEEIKTPGYLLREMAAFGSAIGDCDDYVVLLGALYLRQGHTVVLHAISRQTDTLLDHVYLSVDGIVADAIVDHPFGWEVPADEVTYRMDLAA